MLRNSKILVVSPVYPYPPLDGHKVRIYNLFKQFSTEYRFDFIAFGDSDESPETDVLIRQLGPSFDSVELVSNNTLNKLESKRWISKIRNIVIPYEDSISAYYSAAMAARIREKISSTHYDLIYLCGLSISLYLDKSTEVIPYIVDIGDSISLLCKSYYKKECNLISKLKKYLDYFWATRYEKIYGSEIRNIIMISTVDAEMIKKSCPHSRIWVVPNGVDTEHFKRTDTGTSKAFELLFTGVMDYPPNNEAMLYFIEKIFPMVKETQPDVTLTIAGRDPSPELRFLAGKTSGVTLTGYVEDLRPFFKNATIYIAPLLSGAGVKNKVLEAWSMSLPVVATQTSCDGIMTINNKNILIANGPADFAAKILTLLSNEPLRGRLSSEGRNTVEREYAWMSRSKMLSSIFEEIIGIASSPF